MGSSTALAHGGKTATRDRAERLMPILNRDLVDLVARVMAANLRLQNLLIEIGEEGHIRRNELLERMSSSKRLLEQVARILDSSHNIGESWAASRMARRLQRAVRRKLALLSEFEQRITPPWDKGKLRIVEDQG